VAKLGHGAHGTIRERCRSRLILQLNRIEG